jgi:Co/Zn/Cd efflux system component
MSEPSKELRRAVAFVAVANLGYFGVEFFFALRAGSVSLFADSIDFLEDASINFLILLVLNWSPRSRSSVGRGLAGMLLIPGIATIWTAITKLSSHHIVPTPEALSIVGAGALLVNAACAFRLVSFRHHSGSLTKAAFLSARNDVLANVAIIVTGFITAATHSFWPDLVVGLGITLMNADAAKEVWGAARQEHLESRA